MLPTFSKGCGVRKPREPSANAIWYKAHTQHQYQTVRVWYQPAVLSGKPHARHQCRARYA
eukprot:916021-Rhodomonas_salina.3